MAVCRGLLLLLALLGSVSLTMLYRWDMSQKNEAERIHQMLEQRKQLLRETCDSDEEAFPKKRSLDDLSNYNLDHLLVDDYHGIIYCYIPKVACTNWKKIMYVLKLNHSEPYSDPMSISYKVVHRPGNLPQLISYPRTEIKARLKHYTKFMFVRDPFVRLISAYRNKFMLNNRLFYAYARVMLHKYGNVPNPPMSSDKAFSMGMRPTFYNFIQYLVDPQTLRTGFNDHWMQMHRLCHPCIIQYDFVGHLETVSQDAEQLLKSLMLEDAIKMPPAYEHVTSSDYVMDWFKTVPLEDRRKLYKIYEQDFKLFGYRMPGELLDG